MVDLRKTLYASVAGVVFATSGAFLGKYCHEYYDYQSGRFVSQKIDRPECSEYDPMVKGGLALLAIGFGLTAKVFESPEKIMEIKEDRKFTSA